MRKILFFALVWLAAIGNPATAAGSCDFSYTDDLRRTLILPALAQYSPFRDNSQDVVAAFDLQQVTINSVGRDGTLILAFDKPSTIDGSTLLIVVDPCERQVVYVTEVQEGIAYSVTIAFKTDHAMLNAGLIGSWILPPDNWLYNPNDPDGNPNIKLRTVQTFRTEGTGSTDIYKDGPCTILERSIPFTWTLNGSTLTISAANADPKAFLLETSHIGIAMGRKPDRLMSYTANHDDGYQLYRAARCGWPGNAER